MTLIPIVGSSWVNAAVARLSWCAISVPGPNCPCWRSTCTAALLRKTWIRQGWAGGAASKSERLPERGRIPHNNWFLLILNDWNEGESTNKFMGTHGTFWDKPRNYRKLVATLWLAKPNGWWVDNAENFEHGPRNQVRLGVLMQIICDYGKDARTQRKLSSCFCVTNSEPSMGFPIRLLRNAQLGKGRYLQVLSFATRRKCVYTSNKYV